MRHDRDEQDARAQLEEQQRLDEAREQARREARERLERAKAKGI